MIAHRLAALRDADTIAVLRDGVIAEQPLPERASPYSSIHQRRRE
jgi:ABC-type transport system involved in Fe-S cluster assembly fused permease/ATPase subunit